MATSDRPVLYDAETDTSLMPVLPSDAGSQLAFRPT